MIMQAMTNFIFRSVAPRDIRHVATPDLKRMDRLAVAVSTQMASEFQTAPPLMLHHPIPRVMAGVWAVSREAYVADHAGRRLREAVCSEISKINQCPYCVDVHVAMLHGLGEAETASGVVTGDTAQLDDATRAAVAWAAANRTPSADILRHPPFTPDAAPKIIGTALVFHYLNRMVHLFLPDSPLPIPASLGWLKRNATGLFGRTIGSRISTRAAGNDPFPLEDEPAELPPEFHWAWGDRRVAMAFALFAKVAEEAGHAHVHPQVRECVIDRLAGWQGGSPGLGRAWLEQAVSGLDAEQQPAARLGLLTALASYQATAADIAAVKEQASSPAALIGLTAWASYQAMKRIATWLDPADATAPAALAGGSHG